jgi:hypothetical protein
MTPIAPDFSSLSLSLTFKEKVVYYESLKRDLHEADVCGIFFFIRWKGLFLKHALRLATRNARAKG